MQPYGSGCGDPNQSELIDDLTGDKADKTVLFGIDGREFEIDLSRDHAGEFRDNLARYLAKARKVGKFTRCLDHCETSIARSAAEPGADRRDPRMGAREWV